MPLLTVDDLREHTTTSLGDDALQRILDANEAAIIRRAGALGEPIVEFQYQNGYESILLLRRKVEVTVSPLSPVIVEGYGFSDARTLADDDWVLTAPATIRRIDFGTNPGIYFLTPVRVEYTPLDDTDERIGVLIALSQLDVNFKPGLASFTTGKHSETYGRSGNSGGSSYLEDREALLNGLANERLFA